MALILLHFGQVDQIVCQRRQSLDLELNVPHMDCEKDLLSFYSFMRTSILIASLGLLSVFILLLLLSGRIVKPVAESYEKQKRFITDAGHEIKTPLTIISADADVGRIEHIQTD